MGSLSVVCSFPVTLIHALAFNLGMVFIMTFSTHADIKVLTPNLLYDQTNIRSDICPGKR